MIVTGESGRGTKSTDRYALKGLSQALDRVAQECKYVASGGPKPAQRADHHYSPDRSPTGPASGRPDDRLRRGTQ